MVDPNKASTEVNLFNPGLHPTLQRTLQCMGHTQRSITGAQTYPISKLHECLEAPRRFINRPRRTDTSRSNTLYNTGVTEICRWSAKEEED